MGKRDEKAASKLIQVNAEGCELQAIELPVAEMEAIQEELGNILKRVGIEWHETWGEGFAVYTTLVFGFGGARRNVSRRQTWARKYMVTSAQLARAGKDRRHSNPGGLSMTR